MENYAQVVTQMEAFGVEFKGTDLPLQIPTVKRKTCGLKGKYWYWLQLFRRHDGREYVVGRFGTYKHGGSDQKVDVDWVQLTDQERERIASERKAAQEQAKASKEAAADLAALDAAQLWRNGLREGRSPYLDRKGVKGEACRYLAQEVYLARHNKKDRPIYLPPGTLLLPLLRYDLPRDEALRGLQIIKSDGFKFFTEGFGKNGCALRLGHVSDGASLVLVCEGYATGLTIRVAIQKALPVYVALDAYNLAPAVSILRELHPDARLLICADDDWKTEDHEGPNPGRRAAMKVAKATEACDIVWPVFAAASREEKDTDFNDLQMREGLPAASRQLLGVVSTIQKMGARA